MSNPASDHRALFLGEDGNLHLKDSAGDVTDVGGDDGGGGGVLGVTCYYPGSPADISITSATLADVDATNARVTFTAPASGNVIVQVGVACKQGTGFLGLGLRESTTIIGQLTIGSTSGSSVVVRATETFYLTGVSAGSHTYKLAALQNTGGTGHIYIDQVGDGPLTMVVFAAP